MADKKKYIVRVDVPITGVAHYMISVEAEDEDAAEKLGVKIIADDEVDAKGDWPAATMDDEDWELDDGPWIIDDADGNKVFDTNICGIDVYEENDE